MSKWSEHPAFPYYAGFVLWLLFSLGEKLHPNAVYLLDPIETFSIGVILAREWYRLPSFGKIRWGEDCLIGLLVFGIWVYLSSPSSRHPTSLYGFNPFYLFGHTDMSYGMLFFHLVGFVVVTPMAEELFWRGFFMRYLIQKNFQEVQIGFCTPVSFIVTTVLYALAHGLAWPSALAAGAIFGWWFVNTKGLANIIIAHAVANLAWACYVLSVKEWSLW